MLWKSDRSPSLATQLVSWYTLSTIGLLAVLAISLYPTLYKLITQLAGQSPQKITLECYKTIIIALLLASVGALLLGHWITKKSLFKIEELKQSMERISITALNERVHLNDWPNELKPLGSCFNEMLIRLNDAFTQLSQFSSDIAHELRTPIHSLKQMTELELSKPDLSFNNESLLLNYMSELNHINQLIEQLLFLARSEHHHILLNKENVSLKQLIQPICEFYQLLADEKNMVISCEGDANVFVDTTLFKRLLSNLLSNAIKYTPAYGKININIKLISVNKVQVSIQDTGIGIDAAHLPKLCHRFYRVDPTRTQNDGLGLGLAIVETIMKLHDGEIFFQSQRGQGTTVFLYF